MERDRGCEPREGWQLALQWGRGGVCGWGSVGVRVARGLASTFFLQAIGGRWPPKLRRPQSGGAPHLDPPSSGDRRCPLLSQTWEFITACRPGSSQASGQR